MPAVATSHSVGLLAPLDGLPAEPEQRSDAVIDLAAGRHQPAEIAHLVQPAPVVLRPRFPAAGPIPDSWSAPSSQTAKSEAVYTADFFALFCFAQRFRCPAAIRARASALMPVRFFTGRPTRPLPTPVPAPPASRLRACVRVAISVSMAMSKSDVFMSASVLSRPRRPTSDLYSVL